MTMEQFRTYQEETFDSFCKTVIRNTAKNEHLRIAKRAKYEIQMSAVSTAELSAVSCEDTYFPYCQTYYVLGKAVNIYDADLGESLRYIIPQWRDVILLFYFLGYSDEQIAKMLKMSFRTVNYRRKAALKDLRRRLEGMESEQ